MAIQWYPGHMSRAKKEFQEKLKLVDVVFEIRDARIPMSSKNPDIEEIIGEKPRLIIFLKNDLADQRESNRWLNWLSEKNEKVLFIDVNQKKQVNQIEKAALELLNERGRQERREKKQLKERAIRAVVTGIPNVGKSTLINRLAGKKVAQIGDTPGVTKGQQWIRQGSIELLDTPGILWPKFDSEEIGLRLSITGAISDRVVHIDDTALYAMEYLQKHYPGALSKRYKLTEEEENLDTVDMLLAITRKRGFQDDYEQGSQTIINEIRKGLLGPVTFDRVEEDWKDY